MDGEKWTKKKLQFIAVVSFFAFFSFLFSYYSGFSTYNLQFSTLIFHAIDRKYVFLTCNGILALLLNNFSFGGFIKCAEDGEMPAAAVSVEENEYGYGAGDHEMKAAEDGLESEEEEDEEITENTTVEEVNDGSVSTEELNQKFEEFIRKMKEEIRVEAQQHLLTV